MQDIDFGRFYRQKRRVTLSEMAQEKRRKHHLSFLNKNMLFLISGCLLFAAGIMFGSRWERYSYTRQIENNTMGEEITTANVAPTEKQSMEQTIKVEKNIATTQDNLPQSNQDNDKKNKKIVAAQEQVEQALKNTKDAYLILAKIYADEKEAYLHGRELKKQGLPVFLARSGKKIKVYVGPIEGKTAAYQQLAIVKNMPEFRSAIMYKK